MTFHKLFVAFATLTFVTSLTAQDKGYWRAESNNAKAITGDFSLSDTKLTLNFSSFTVAHIRALNSAEVAALFDADASAGFNGALYRLMIPADKRFLHKNTLCGTSDTQWMATFVTGRDLKVAFFSGENVPVLTIDSLANSMDVCGSFTYTR
jgi:hypothetical protein